MFQVLKNLLANASEHSPESSAVRVRISLEDVLAVVSIENDGRGASTDSLYNLFNEYRRADGQDMGQRSGRDDLSLAICKGIVEAHGGRMSADGAGPGRGVRFTFTVPVVDEVAYNAESGPDHLTASSRHRGTDQVRVLVVDDAPETRRYLRSTLSEAGFTPVFSGNPDDLERLVDAEKPHVVLMEMTLPWADPFDVMERIQRISDAPVLLLMSGYGSSRTMDRAFELGAADYVVKPFTPTELVARIKSTVRRRASTVQNEASEPFVLGDLTIDYVERVVTVAGRRVQLTATEYRLLVELATAAGRVLTHAQLLRRAWGPEYSGDSQIVYTYIKQLRNKLEDDARRPSYLFTEPRLGYRMAKPTDA